MVELQLAFSKFSTLMFEEMSKLNKKVDTLKEELEESKGQQKFNRKEAMAFFGVSNPTFQRFINDGLPTHGTPKKQIFFKDEMLQFMRDRPIRRKKNGLN